MLNRELLKNAVTALAFLAWAGSARGALMDVGNSPLVTSSSASVLPNIMFILDDSGSMDLDYMPDWASTSTANRKKNPDYNGIAYNPAITYSPPIYYNTDGTLNTTSYKSQTSANTAGWTQVKSDGYNIQDTVTTDLTASANRPVYFTTIAGEYCTEADLRSCVAQSAPSETHPYPAKLRWCQSSSDTTAAPPVATGRCQGVWIGNGAPNVPAYYYNARLPSQYTAQITLSGSSSAVVTKVQVDGKEILSAATVASSTRSTVAGYIRDNINVCTDALVGQCQVIGYSATASGSTVTISAPTTMTATPAVTLTGMTAAVTAFGPGTVPGALTRSAIHSSVNSYPYPGTATKASTRGDCAGTTCTYAEEMTNYANWWAYYRTRMQMMKSSTSIAFAPVDSAFRVGYITINLNASQDFRNIDTFNAANKKAWYDKLFASNPNNATPLRGALSKIGRLYAGKLKNTTSSTDGVTALDPVQYSCQQNFTILSTDGYWNESATPKQVNNSTDMGDQDGGETPPMKDRGSTPNTLADVAEYYYKNDIRVTASPFGNNCTGALGAGVDVCENNVPKSGADGASWQHMTTYTLGLGASGYMQFSPSYVTDASGDFYDVKAGTSANAANGICPWQNNGTTCNWPIPVNNSQPNIDDLWHAAVNGRGSYFSATDPASLAAGLDETLKDISKTTGSSAAASASNPNITSGDNFVFSSTFTTVEWTGDLRRQRLGLTSAYVETYNPAQGDWSAQEQLETKIDTDGYAGRAIKTYSAGAADHLKPFQWDQLTATEQAYFNLPYIANGVNGLSQFCGAGPTCLAAADQTDAAGEKLVNYLRGDRANEGVSADTDKYFRQRVKILGDIVNAEAAYVRRPMFSYEDAGYSDFVASQEGRTAIVYAAANDGMLHAFRGDSGEEAWTYIPNLVLPNLYRLADKNYANMNKHRFFVDGSPMVGDVCPVATCGAGDWKTILVGGLNAGGRGYYALDVTNPASPSVLWEFTDPDMGYTFGNPVITKLKNGTWVVLLTSGYNNAPETGNPYYNSADGKGHLYVLNAYTGQLIRDISTGEGTPATPSGLARISAWTNDADADNTALRVYGGDNSGNLWRFDINGDVGASGYDAQRLATFKDANGVAQPVTARPELGDVGGLAVVYVGTGRYLGTTDLNPPYQTQSFYAVKDPLDTTNHGNPRSNGGFVKQTLTATTCPTGTKSSICTTGELVRTSSNNPVDWSQKKGWYLDLPESGERANTDPALAYGILVFNTNIPGATVCTLGGTSYRYFVDYRTGGTLAGSENNVTGVKLGNALAARGVVVSTGYDLVQLSRLSNDKTENDVLPPSNAEPPRRSSWRELPTD